MRVLRSLAAMAAVALLYGPALAADAPPPPPDPQKVAEARAAADAAITRLGLGDQFENASDGELARVRHKASGLTCDVGDDPASFLIVVAPSQPAGDDVSCSFAAIGQTTLRAVRYAKTPTVKQALATAIEGLSGDVERVQLYKGPSISAMSDLTKKLQIGTLRLTGIQKGKPVFVRLSAMVIGDWVYVQKIVAPDDMATAADLLGEIEMVLQVAELMKPEAK
ncbi:hypothetical protein QO010_000100 [Caulobacter ginsengisoli]|uniref:Uncharacterized protein n=1 Tax=Caulobacter ginsengisoli TaxID=400775 RepID=A0ABU0IK39_9CAUL|nr:hypothetical protein [Caulobacter ginsengisoli]MDQ0462352.1 hypothetical protein [Caulobacter ginsengisoli]